MRMMSGVVILSHINYFVIILFVFIVLRVTMLGADEVSEETRAFMAATGQGEYEIVECAIHHRRYVCMYVALGCEGACMISFLHILLSLLHFLLSSPLVCFLPSFDAPHVTCCTPNITPLIN